MRKMSILRCSHCQIPISVAVQQLRNFDLVRGNDGEDVMPQGWFTRAGDLRQHLGYSPDDVSLGHPDELVLNLDDLQNTHLGGVLNGCCGIDGCDGINTFCVNGHEIGTERSDCWTLCLIHIPPERVVVE